MHVGVREREREEGAICIRKGGVWRERERRGEGAGRRRSCREREGHIMLLREPAGFCGSRVFSFDRPFPPACVIISPAPQRFASGPAGPAGARSRCRSLPQVLHYNICQSVRTAIPRIQFETKPLKYCSKTNTAVS